MQVYSLPAEVPAPNLGDFVHTGGRFDHAGYVAAEATFLATLKDWVLKVGEAHPLAGEVVSVPYADSSAQYMVAKLQGKVILVHLPLGDAWRSDQFERLCTVAELKRMVDASQKRAAFFAAKQAEKQAAP